MPARKSHRPSKVRPPLGFAVIFEGVVSPGDLAWATERNEWKQLQKTEFGNPVKEYVSVARSKQ